MSKLDGTPLVNSISSWSFHLILLPPGHEKCFNIYFYILSGLVEEISGLIASI